MSAFFLIVKLFIFKINFLEKIDQIEKPQILIFETFRGFK